MKKWLSLGLSVLLLLVFTAAPTSYALACCSKNAKKEVKSASQPQKECCKAQAKCKKACCKKDIAPHNKKQCKENGCNGDCNGNCSCAVSVFVYAVLESSVFTLSHLVPVFEDKQGVFFQESFPKSVSLSFWQPPKI